MSDPNPVDPEAKERKEILAEIRRLEARLAEIAVKQFLRARFK